MHAAALATALEIPRVLVPKFPGALSALGILRADVIKEFSRTVHLDLAWFSEAQRVMRRTFLKVEQEGLKQMTQLAGDTTMEAGCGLLMLVDLCSTLLTPEEEVGFSK